MSGAASLPERERIKELRRDLRERLELEATAFSADGREFSYEAPISADIQVGGWVVLDTTDGRRFLAQITTEDIAVTEGPQINLALDDDQDHQLQGGRMTQAGFRVRIRHTAGSGVLLARETDDGKLVPPRQDDTFDAATIAAADGEIVARYLAAMSGTRAALRMGIVERCAGDPVGYLRADGFDRHTFLCGQSGSGKTYALGLLLEQLVLHTDLNIIIIDPNSDFVRLGEVRQGVAPKDARAYRARAKALQVLRPSAVAENRRKVLRAWFSDLAEAEQASALRLDPIADREEYSELSAIAASIGERRYSLDDVLERARSAEAAAGRDLALRIENLHVAEWDVWATGKQPSSSDVIRESTRATVADIGALASASEKAAVSATVLGNLWRRREQRRPTLIVIDEAHNVCPAEPANALQANATEYCVNIAAEGRKFGLYLLISTQRPQKVHRNVLSQCDNVMLMRMNSRADLAELSDVFSFIAPSLIEESMRFRQGETLLAGKIVPTPLIARVSGRISEEGGADVPATWAEQHSRKPRAKRRTNP
jgi:uncharacterized protein